MSLMRHMKTLDRANSAAAEPAIDCDLCPRLFQFRASIRDSHPEWFNGAVRSFGSSDARLLIVGLAPGMRGANRTGRPFTGDFAGDLLYATLKELGFAIGTYGADPNDGLTLNDCMITNAVRCVPPQNKPTGEEIRTCRPFLLQRIAQLPDLAAIVALGRIAHESVVRTLGGRVAAYKFAHQAVHEIDGIRLYDSYHCSRYNTNTGRLTPEMFRSVFKDVRKYIGPSRQGSI